MSRATLLLGDALEVLRLIPAESVHCCVTSPPYWGLRDYGVPGQIGLERSLPEWLERVVGVMTEVRRVLRKDGTLWLNLGDCFVAAPAGMDRSEGEASTLTGGDRRGRRTSYDRGRNGQVPEGSRGVVHRRALGLKPKDLVGQPWRLAFALQDAGWWLRRDVVWHKPNAMPESVRDRPASSHEYLFLLAKSRRYYYDGVAIAEPLTGNAHPRGNGVGPKTAEHGIGVRANESFARSTSGNLERNRGEHAGATSDVGRNVPWDADESGLRNARSVWTIPTQPYPGPHYATFPEELARRCILAGSSARGCCSSCGAPWSRKVQGRKAAAFNVRLRDDQAGRTRDKSYYDRNVNQAAAASYDEDGYGGDGQRVEWRAGCRCQAGEPVPCTVLDPFGGSGTVAQVATGNGRAATWIDLDPDNVELARQRIGPLLCDVARPGEVLYANG